jgi:hypothetical protein
MQLDKQKNFYDRRRYFQGKDNPGTPHPEPGRSGAPPRGQIVVGLLFLAFVGLLAFLRVRAAREEGAPAPAAAVAAAPATK